MKKNRNASIELLRFISAFMIVLSHSSVHGGFKIFSNPTIFNNTLLRLVNLGNLGVVIFVLISGYVANSSPLKFKAIKRIYLPVIFYSLLWLLIARFTGYELSKNNYLQSFFPITYRNYWFITAFIAMLIISPAIYTYYSKVDRKTHLLLIGIMILVWSLLPTILNERFYRNEVLEMICLFSIGMYLGRFRDNKFSNKYFRYMTLIVSIVFILGFVYIFSSKQIFDNFQPNMDFDEYVKQSSFVMNRLSPLILLLGVSLLTIFAYGKEINNNFILFLGASSLPIYLAHDNNISRNIIWRTILNNTAYYESNSLIFRLILSAILVVIAALLIEFLRKIIGQLFNSIWGKIKLTK